MKARTRTVKRELKWLRVKVLKVKELKRFLKSGENILITPNIPKIEYRSSTPMSHSF